MGTSIHRLRQFVLCFLFSGAAFLLSGCVSKDDYGPEFEAPESDYTLYVPRGLNLLYETTSATLPADHPAIKIMQKRARRIARIAWSPRGAIPQNNGKFLTNSSYLGIPYSSVKELNKFIGQDVSFHTFLAAVNNPKSVLYTENVCVPPYKGSNCASYYGTVCSTTVNYALGLNRPFGSDMYDTLSCVKRLADQSFEAMAPGDIVWRKGHVVLITDVQRKDNGSIDKVEVLESSGMGTSLINYSLADFESRWVGYNWVIYRYLDLAGLDDDYDAFMWDDNLLSVVNEELSLTRGNWVAYREGETVVANVLSPNYSSIELSKDGTILETRALTGQDDVVYTGLKPGMYQLQLVGEEEISQPVDFEIVDTRIVVSRSGKWLKIVFDSVNAKPEFIMFCDGKGAPAFISDLTEVDKARGYAFVKCEKNINSLYLKVFFKGTFGRVSNEIFPL